MSKRFVLAVVLCLLLGRAGAQWVTELKTPGAMDVLTAAICVDAGEDTLIRRAAVLLQHDIEKVTGKTLPLVNGPGNYRNLLLVGTFRQSPLLQKMVAAGKIADKVGSKWEAYQVQVVQNPVKGLLQCVVIAGSDKRGTAYGVFDMSRQMGVSPWYWWADVPVNRKAALYVKAATAVTDAPRVKYRGIFINDEAPAFSGWTKEKFGGVNHLVYEKMFELLLRLKANYLWPAMWGNAFNDDDTLNPVLAQQWGIVMGTTHHEPMLRAQQEWKRYGKGQWNYDSNAVALRAFWKKGIENMGSRESIVCIGMRGDGDMPMTQGTAISLLEKIVADQRKIIEDVTHKPAAQTPQLWALYKEVQDYYDKGMRVPDDVTLLLCDDNWGNLRRLPKPTGKPRSGGYGIYYHFDYVGGPRNYKWINTNNIARVWEQMHLAAEYGADRIWIVNVGDLKPMEFPISFFLDYAWDTKKWNQDNLPDYFTQWAAGQFGPAQAKEIGQIIQQYSQYNARRKPELLSPATYSLTSYQEADNVVKQYRQLLQQAEKINGLLPERFRDAYFELVLHPVMASCNLNEMYVAAAWSRYYAALRSPLANQYAAKAKQLYANDSLITLQYHRVANGKWNHMMDQTHIGYTYWQQPPVNRMPDVMYVKQDAGTLKSPVDMGSSDSGHMASAYPQPGVNTEGKSSHVFYERQGVVSIEAADWTRAINSKQVAWKVIPGIGRTGSGISTFPVTAAAEFTGASPHVEYDFYSSSSGKVELSLYFSPTLNFLHEQGLTCMVSLDDGPPYPVVLNKDDDNTRIWEGWVADNIIVQKQAFILGKAGKHVLKYWMISPAVVLQKLVVDFGGLQPSYLGPPASRGMDRTEKK